MVDLHCLMYTVEIQQKLIQLFVFQTVSFSLELYTADDPNVAAPINATVPVALLKSIFVGCTLFFWSKSSFNLRQTKHYLVDRIQKHLVKCLTYPWIINWHIWCSKSCLDVTTIKTITFFHLV